MPDTLNHADPKVNEVAAKFETEAFPRLLGVKLLEVTPGCARVEMKLTGEMLNFHGIAHGGAVFSLADTAFAVASNSRGQAVALQVSINFTGAVREGTILTATAKEEALTRKTGIYNIVVEDDHGNTIALFRGIVYRKE